MYLQFPEDVENYQPISILPIVAKMFEKEVQHQVYAFLTKHELLHPCQHGFCARRSTHTALLTVVDKWLQGMDNGQVSPVVFLDLAFDTVRHLLLLKKLPTLKMCSTEVDWFSSYQTNHQQRVICNGTLSMDQPSTCGVPQGSVLGPLLFLMCKHIARMYQVW